MLALHAPCLTRALSQNPRLLLHLQLPPQSLLQNSSQDPSAPLVLLLQAERDLAPLPHRTARNPHYRSAAPMRLYSVALVQAACLAKQWVGGEAAPSSSPLAPTTGNLEP